MENISNNFEISGQPKEKTNIEKIKQLLEKFKFKIPEDQLPFIEILYRDNFRIDFKTKSGKRYTGFETNACPENSYHPTYYGFGQDRFFLGQKIIERDDVVRLNWFKTKDNTPFLEKAFFQCKINKNEYVLEIQKDFQKDDKLKTFDVIIYSGTLETICPNYHKKDIIEAESDDIKLRMKYRFNNDYNYYESNFKDSSEIRYIYGRNMYKLTDFEYIENGLADNRIVYGVTYVDDNIAYYGVIAEDGSKSFKKIKPMEWSYLPDCFTKYEAESNQPQSKIYFSINERNGNPKYLGIIKNKEGNIKAFIDEVQFNSSENRLTTTRLNDYEEKSRSEGTITV